MEQAIRQRKINLVKKYAHCKCGAICSRHSIARRTIHEIGLTCPTALVATYSKHYCEACRKHFSIDMSHIAPPRSKFTNRVRKAAVDLVIHGAMSLDDVSMEMQRKYYVRVPPTTMHDWVVLELRSVGA